jgi:hypothetical protein
MQRINHSALGLPPERWGGRAMRTTRVSYDRPDVRRDKRYPLPTLVITIDGELYETVNWSLGGFLVTGFARHLEPGASITGSFRLADQPISVDFVAEVVRVDGPARDHLGAKFTDLGEHGMSVLERIITRRLFRG